MITQDSVTISFTIYLAFEFQAMILTRKYNVALIDFKLIKIMNLFMLYKLTLLTSFVLDKSVLLIGH